jgi:hypothetical protein
MANTKISDLSILGKSSFVSDDYILVARGTTSNAKVQATSLLPTLTNLGNGSNYLLNPITSQNVFSQKQLLVSGGILALANNTNDLTLSINQGSINLNSCNNDANFLQTVDLSTNKVTSTLPTVRGGTGLSSFAAKSVFISHPSTANTMQALSISQNGQLLIGGTSGPAVRTLTAGSNITITNGDGTIQISAPTPASVVSKSGESIVLTSGGGLTSDGDIIFNDVTKGIVYGTKGIAKTEINQSTSFATPVTINATLGKINLYAGSLAAATQAEFTVTNPTVQSTSLVFITMIGPGAATEADNAYITSHVSAISNGSFKIVLTNTDGHNSDTLQRSIQFLVIN